ncbi:hypothetical protein [Rubritalea profundi]|nr:hypothetical protein [Rubritalea profundi]
MATTLLAAPQQWKNSTALEHISKVQQRSGPLNDLFIIAAGVPPDRMVWLERKLASIKLKNLSEEYRFSVLSSQQLGDFAMVIVAVEDPRNPLFYETVSLGFCWKNQKWRAAPLPGIFSLTDVGRYQKGAKKHREALELWVHIESKRLQELGERTLLKALDQKLAKYKQPGMPLRDGTKDEAVEYFMQMAQQKDTVGLLACVLDDRYNVAVGVLSHKSVWSQLLQKNFTYSILPDVGIDGVVSVGVYFPDRSPSQGILEFRLTMSEGCWVIKIPESLKSRIDGDFPSRLSQHAHLEPLNRKRVSNVKSLILHSLSKISVESDRELLEKLLVVAAEQDFHSYIQLIDWKVSFLDGGLELSSGELDKRFSSAFELWQKLSVKKSSIREYLYEDRGDNYVLCNLVRYSASTPLVLSSQPLLIVNNETSWTLVPEFTLKDDHDPSLLSKQKLAELRKHIEGAKSKFHKRLLQKAVDGMSLVLMPLTESERPQIIAFYNGFIKNIASQKLEEALGCMANTSKKPEVLLSTVGADAKRWKSPISHSELHSVLMGEKIALIILKETYKDNTSIDFIACPVVRSSDHGYRIFPNYFRYEHGRGEKIANQNMLKEMETSLDKEFNQIYLKLIKKFTLMVNEEIKQENGNNGE